MYARNKVIAIESIVVMFVLILLSFVVFLMVQSGSSAYDNIIRNKENSESARVAYSYINMKIKQNDSYSNVTVVDTSYGGTLKMDTEDGGYSTYIFFSDGTLYECLTKKDEQPVVAAANKITSLCGFDVDKDGRYINISCVSESNGTLHTVKGTVGLRT